ncbi:LPXTG cell wall anchor domain-containing protein [Streptomyces sp. NPDC047108]|uniref:COG1470 family protein n=1 Tax=Streptomyces sp. NPDC047108 TaxID=3155025 RepID=UPI0033BFE89D
MQSRTGRAHTARRAPRAATALASVPAVVAALCAAVPAGAAVPAEPAPVSVPAAPPPASVSAPAAAKPDWSAAPASGGGSRPSTGGRPYFYLEGRPGTVLEDTVTVTNSGPHARIVRLRGADGYTGDAGAFAVRGPGRSTASGSWVTLASAKVKVPPRTRADIPFTVTVPPDAVPGDHPAAIVATGGGRDAGVRLHLRVTGPTLAALSVEDVSVVRTGGGAEIHYALVNRGNTALAPRLAVRADGLFGGGTLRRAARDLPVELLPGARVRLTEQWPGAPRLDTADVTLTATAAGGARATATASYSPFPWAASAAALLGLLAAGAGGWYLRRRRRSRAGPASGGARREEGREGPHEAPGARELADAGSGAAR